MCGSCTTCSYMYPRRSGNLLPSTSRYLHSSACLFGGSGVQHLSSDILNTHTNLLICLLSSSAHNLNSNVSFLGVCSIYDLLHSQHLECARLMFVEVKEEGRKKREGGGRDEGRRKERKKRKKQKLN